MPSCDVCGEDFDTERGVSIHSGQKHSEQRWRDEDLLRELYVEQEKTIYEVADEIDSNPVTVQKWLKRHGIGTRTIEESQRLRYGTDAPVSLKLHRDGYQTAYFNRDYTYYEVRIHRLAAVAWFGYDAVVGNDIHHKNGIPWDNREGNLQPLSPSEHKALHADELTRNSEGEITGITRD